MLRHPGVVTLHDFCLAGFHLHYGHARGLGSEFIADELRRWYPEDARRDRARRSTPGPTNWEEIARDCARRGWYLNRAVLDAAELHGRPFALVRDAGRGRRRPEYADRVVVIPHGIHPRRTTDGRAGRDPRPVRPARTTPWSSPASGSSTPTR